MFLKSLVASVACVCCLSSVSQAAEGWVKGLDAAKKIAAEKKLPIFVEFTGSTWCGPCKAAYAAIFSKKEFIDEASKRFVLCVVDLPAPRAGVNNDEEKASVETLKKYGVKGVPTVIITNSEGVELGRISPSGKTIKDVIASADKIMSEADMD